MSPNYDKLVSSIYDCAANPELWTDVCCDMRDALSAAFVIGFVDLANDQDTAKWQRHNSPWDERWLDALDVLSPSLPKGRRLHEMGTDIAWTQLGCTSEQEFKQTDFYQQWIEPQKLRDALAVKYLARDMRQGLLSATTKANRAPISDQEKKLAESLSPHIRRAMLINDLTDTGRVAQTLYKQVLDTLSVAVFLVGQGQRLAFANSAGERMLSEAQYLRLAGGSLQPHRDVGQTARFAQAVECAMRGDSSIGSTGIGVPLLNAQGDRAVAYVLPLSGSDARGALGAGHCAVFVTQRGEQTPMAMDVLRSLFDLTNSEARVALLVARGDGPQVIAKSLGVSVHTVRTHLKHCFEKTESSDQTALSGTINALLPPLK
jgi:DNA-binding CsgD family transcriptional regulator